MLDRPKFQTMVIKSTSLKSTDEAEQKHTMACDRHMYKQKHLSLKKQTTHTHIRVPQCSVDRSIDRQAKSAVDGWMQMQHANACKPQPFSTAAAAAAGPCVLMRELAEEAQD